MEVKKPDAGAIWLVGPEPLDSWRFNNILRRHLDMDVVDEVRLTDAQSALVADFGVVVADRQPLPPFSPPLTLNFPARISVLPDFFWLSAGWFCSARVRAAFALPAEVIQYIPITVVAPDPAVHAMQYQIARVLVGQLMIDLERSDVEYKKDRDRVVGSKYIRIVFHNNLFLRQSFRPQAELLHAEESPTSVFATDSLAERVMKAGCLGLAFGDPTYLFPRQGRLIRTARGIEVDGPRARRAHMRLVKQTRAAQAANEPVLPAIGAGRDQPA